MADPDEENQHQENPKNIDSTVQENNEAKDSKDVDTETPAQKEKTETKANDTDNTDNQAQQNKENKPIGKQKKKAKFKSDVKDNEQTKNDNGPLTLKLVQTHYSAHSKSALPHILAEYGLEDKSHQASKKEKPKKKAVKKAESSVDAEEEDRARRRAREQRRLLGLGDNHVQDKYYAEYIEFLEQKVIKQRQEQRDREEARKRALLHEEEESDHEANKKPPTPQKEERAEHRFVRRLEKMELKNDDSFLQGLPRTDIARILMTPTFKSWIVVLQDKLRREGKLKTQADVDQFWRDIRKPEVFYEHFKVKKNVMDHASHPDIEPEDDFNESSAPAHVREDAGPGMEGRSLSHISEASHRGDSWAITQKYQSAHGPNAPKSPKSPRERRRKNSTQVAKNAALDLELRCPKLEMPPLACFSLDLGEKPPDPDEILKRMVLKSREKSRKKHQRKLNKMYQMAMTNTAAANRIMDRHGDITDILEGAALRDVRDFCCKQRELAVFDEPQAYQYNDLQQYYRVLTDPRRPQGEQPSSLQGTSQGQTSLPGSRHSSAGSRRLTPISDTSSRRSTKTKKSKRLTAELQPLPEPMPLSFNEVYTREKTVEAKCLSTLWSNYMHAGSSTFTAHS
ncbi:uncharacterized protein LOC128238969 [Mya arenaria]|uniref:uncharacterized protein LOC128238969 n=1 Tax=Mya arenaria TaxID=6604 RepID=UPI0022E27941|nr:uncharacterized protein LOC128238969 [Mya arenaria]